MNIPKLVLLGAIGSGRTAVATEISAKTGWQVCDADADVSASLPGGVVGAGAEAYEARAKEINLQALSADIAILTGEAHKDEGLCFRLAELREAGTVTVLLRVKSSEGILRTGLGTVRPAGLGPVRSMWAQLEDAIAKGWQPIADLTVDTTGLRPLEVASKILTEGQFEAK